jgi:hypothetical protein
MSLGGGIAGIAGVRFLTLHGTVLQTLADRGAHLAHQGKVFRQGLVGALQHGHAFLAFEDLAQQVAGERPEQGQVDHPHLQLAGGAQIVGHRLGLHAHGTHAQDQVVGVVGLVAIDPLVAPAGELVVLVHVAVEQFRDVVEEIGALGRRGLHVGVLVGDGAGHHRGIHVPDGRHAAALGTVDDFLGWRGGIDQVVRAAQEFGHQFLLRHQHRLDQVGGEEAVHGDDGRGQRQLGGLAADQVQVGGFLGALGEHLDETGIVHAVVVVVAAVHVQGGLGDGAAAQVEHVGQALADGAIEGFVHERGALGGGEVHRPQAGHGHAGGDAGGGVLGFRLQEDQGPAGHVHVAGGRRPRPSTRPSGWRA